VIGVLGYGNQGRAQALNLRDAGCTVTVGARPAGPSAARAQEDRFPVVGPETLGETCDLLALLTPDETHGTILAQLVSASRVKTIVLAHGYSLHFEKPSLREDWDVLLVAPSGPGTSLRREGSAGRIPALVAVHQDRSGHALSRARAYAVAAGCSEKALIETTVREEVELDLFGEQTVLCGGLAALVTSAWEVLVADGFDPKTAYLECVQQISLTAEMISRYGVTGMRERISRLALFGDFTRGSRVIGPKVKEAMAEILDEIRTGRFAKEWADEVRSDCPRIREGLQESRHHPLEEAGRFVRDRARGPAPGTPPDRAQ
jgi:ketol-acid reductoisomerase